MIDGESLTELTLVVTNITLTNIADLTTTLLKLEILSLRACRNINQNLTSEQGLRSTKVSGVCTFQYNAGQHWRSYHQLSKTGRTKHISLPQRHRRQHNLTSEQSQR